MLFVAAACMSILLAPEADRDQNVLFIKDIKNVFHLVYWCLVYLFFKTHCQRINLYQLAKWTLIGLGCLSVLILLGDRPGYYYRLGPFGITQNSYAFNFVVCYGLASWWVSKRFGGLCLMVVTVSFAILMVKSGSRTGVLIIVLLFALIGVFTHPVLRRNVTPWIFPLIMISLLSTYDIRREKSWVRSSAASLIEPLSARTAALLRSPDTALEKDKPWLIRQTQVEKGLDLFERYPILGVGWGHFRYKRGDIRLSQYTYLNLPYDAYALGRSSHNSYIQVLAETGILGSICFILIQLSTIREFLKALVFERNTTIKYMIGASLIGVAIYFWVISAITGAVWYMMFGLFAGTVAHETKLNITSQQGLPFPRWGEPDFSLPLSSSHIPPAKPEA